MDEEQSSSQDATATAQPTQLFNWQASEYIQHQKPAMWYVAFVSVAALVTLGVYLILDQDIFAAIVVALMFIALFVYAVRKPETLAYEINDDGITIGPKHFPYDRFRAFAVMQTTGIPNITFEPLQRFSVPVSMYCAPEDVSKITELLTRFLPRSERQPDFIDKLTHYLRF